VKISVSGPPLQSLTDNIIDELQPSSGSFRRHHLTNGSVFAGHSPDISIRRSEWPASPVSNTPNQPSTSTAPQNNGLSTGASTTIRRLDEGFEDVIGEREGDGSLMTVVWNYLFG